MCHVPIRHPSYKPQSLALLFPVLPGALPCPSSPVLFHFPPFLKLPLLSQMEWSGITCREAPRSGALAQHVRFATYSCPNNS